LVPYSPLFNVIALVSITAGFGIAISTFNGIGEDHVVVNPHTKIGLIVFLIMVIEVFFAFTMPSAPPTV
jgi:cytochrome b561